MKIYGKLVQTNAQKEQGISFSIVPIISEKDMSFKVGNSFSLLIAEKEGLKIGDEALLDVNEVTNTFFSETRGAIVTELQGTFSVVTKNERLINRYIDEMPLNSNVTFIQYENGKQERQTVLATEKQTKSVASNNKRQTVMQKTELTSLGFTKFHATDALVFNGLTNNYETFTDVLAAYKTADATAKAGMIKA